ncbi:hypothetical protein BY458DRAFT_490062 [Sporodiniella umbellata]|nr:hypothetical protein BY458DRAFT_490062 [Sporodiniella umbellata]
MPISSTLCTDTAKASKHKKNRTVLVYILQTTKLEMRIIDWCLKKAVCSNDPICANIESVYAYQCQRNQASTAESKLVKGPGLANGANALFDGYSAAFNIYETKRIKPDNWQLTNVRECQHNCRRWTAISGCYYLANVATRRGSYESTED